ncbi:CPK4, partial [Symbiodinium microadriaticum]
VCAIDVYILRPAGVADLEALIILRLIRAARILRVVRVLKFMRLFHNLHVLIETLSSMMVDLLWGCLLLTTIIVTAGAAAQGC